MKKIMCVLGAVALAASAHAAAVAWNSGSNSNGFKDPDGNSLKSSTLYTMIVTFYDTDGTTVLGTQSDNTASGTGAYSGTYSGYDFVADKTYYASAIISANDGSFTREAGIGSFAIPSDGSNASINFTTGAGFETASQKWGTTWTDTSGGGGSGGVPEPTSGLLLLVGGAMLALRRKQK